jgi:hypothetical protein
MEHQATPTSPTYADVAREPYALVQVRAASLRQLLPSHRLPVIAKTPILILVGVYIADGEITSRQVLLTMLLAACLWTVLYAVNEATDLVAEHGYRVEPQTRVGLIASAAGICLIGAAVSPNLGLLLTLMALGQIAYSVPPLRVKRTWWAVLLLSGVLNPILRLECGVIWGTHAIPVPAYAVFISLHLGAAILSRCLLRRRDARLGYHTAPPRTEWAGMACTGFGLLGAYALSWAGILPRFCMVFTTVAVVFSVYAWSGRATSLSRLRRGWLLFALLALLALAMLLIQRAVVANVREADGHEHTQGLRQHPHTNRSVAAQIAIQHQRLRHGGLDGHLPRRK